MFKILALLAGISGASQDIYQDPCLKDWSHLSLNNKIEMAIGCSEVQKMTVYNDSKLEAILNDK